MKVIEKIETAQVEIRRTKEYVAEDGTIFDNKFDCMDYEAMCERKQELAYLSKTIDYCMELENRNTIIENRDKEKAEYNYWFRPKNDEEIKKLSEYFLVNPAYLIKGQWTCFSLEFDDRYSATTLGERVEHFRELLAPLGYKVIIEKDE